jgi:signal transduction histidine kinase
MRHTKDRGYANEGDGIGAPGEIGGLERLSAALSQFMGGDPPERTYRVAVKNTALATGAPASLWRMASEGPSLIAFQGQGEGRPEKTLAAMKELAAGALEEYEKMPVARARASEEKAKDQSKMSLSPVWTSAGLWGALVRGRSKNEEAGSFVEAMAVALGLAAERAELHEEVGTLRGKIAAAERSRDPMERYQAIGQLAAHSFKELECILGAVAGELRNQAETGRGRRLIECLAEIKRGRDIVSEQLELASLEIPVLKMTDLNELVQGCVREQEDRIHSKGLRLMKGLSPEIPKLLLDGEKVRIALDKAISAAASRSVPDGWLRVESELADGDVVLQVTWEEKGSPGGGCDDMFLAFGHLDKGGTGLLVASQIIREHGGGVRVKRYESGSSALIMDLPVHSNQDRRRKKSRRSGLDRRRPGESQI